SLRPLCRRLQCVHAQSSSRTTGDGQPQPLRRNQAETEGQRGQECGSAALATQVPGVQLHRAEHTASGASDSASSTGAFPAASARNDLAAARREQRADGQRTGRLSHRMARVFWLLRDPLAVTRTRQLGAPTSTCGYLATVETARRALSRTDAPRGAPL